MQNRTKWVDCAKAVAILAVIVDYIYAIGLYTNFYITSASCFAVTLFVILGGITVPTNIPMKTHVIRQLKKTLIFLVQYVLFSVVLMMCKGQVDVKKYIYIIVTFSGSRHLYFVLFYAQLMLVSPMLVAWCKYCDKKANKIIWHVCSAVMGILLSSVFVQYTYIIPVHGGGQYLLGGTFFGVYYIGIILGVTNFFADARWTNVRRVIAVMVSLFMYALLVHMREADKLYIDKVLAQFFGEGVNPPSVQLFLAFSMLLICYVTFSYLLEIKVGYIRSVMRVINFVGTHTLYIFYIM